MIGQHLGNATRYRHGKAPVARTPAHHGPTDRHAVQTRSRQARTRLQTTGAYAHHHLPANGEHANYNSSGRGGAPLGLSDTRYDLTQEQQQRVVRAFFPHGKPTPSWYHDVLMPQGGLRSTINDLLTFAEANLAAGTGADRSALGDAMRLARTPIVTRQEHYDPTNHMAQQMAWRGVEGHDRASEHGGSTLFYQTGFAVDDNCQVGLVMLSSSYDNMATLEGVAQRLGNQPLQRRFLHWFDLACSL